VSDYNNARWKPEIRRIWVFSMKQGLIFCYNLEQLLASHG